MSRWDIFCRVVDNFGDIGVCWRLARQLAAEHGLAVGLWVDDLRSFARIEPAIDPGLARQDCAGVKVSRWDTALYELPPDGVADVVIEAFACELPEAYMQAMARRGRAPVWINLEYLSAEAWVAGCHGLPSPHPRLPLTKYFFFPGFDERSGGLVRERDLLARRDAFLADAAAQERFWRELEVGPRQGGELRISLFSYAQSAVPQLLTLWAASPTPLLCLIPEGPAASAAADRAAAPSAAPGSAWRRGALDLRVLPFLPQPRYDQLLWACDVNFVRGEDSFVRAQWAGKPMIWNIYPQRENAHRAKLAAFLERYCEGMAAPSAAAVTALHQAWNGGAAADLEQAWAGFLARREELAQHGRIWSAALARQADLASALVEFCGHRL